MKLFTKIRLTICGTIVLLPSLAAWFAGTVWLVSEAYFWFAGASALGTLVTLVAILGFWNYLWSKEI